MIRKFFVAFLFVMLTSHYFQPRAQSAQPLNDPAKLVRMLEESALTYTKVQEGIWAVPYNGKSSPDFNVVISGQKDVVVVFAVVAEKKNLKVTPEMMRIMLRLNNDIDRVKVLIDDEGDAVIRIDMSLRTLDSQELKYNIAQVAYATTEAHKAMKQFITIAK